MCTHSVLHVFCATFLCTTLVSFFIVFPLTYPFFLVYGCALLLCSYAHCIRHSSVLQVYTFCTVCILLCAKKLWLAMPTLRTAWLTFKDYIRCCNFCFVHCAKVLLFCFILSMYCTSSTHIVNFLVRIWRTAHIKWYVDYNFLEYYFLVICGFVRGNCCSQSTPSFLVPFALVT